MIRITNIGNSTNCFKSPPHLDCVQTPASLYQINVLSTNKARVTYRTVTWTCICTAIVFFVCLSVPKFFFFKTNQINVIVSKRPVNRKLTCDAEAKSFTCIW